MRVFQTTIAIQSEVLTQFLFFLIMIPYLWWHGQAVRQGPAKPLSPVRIWVPPIFISTCLESMFHIVSLPIGNLEDMSFRAVKTLKMCNLVLAEDTRISRKIFNTYDIKTPMISFHRFNEKKQETTILKRLQEGQHLALISDAGTPGICDPGSTLITLCRSIGIPMQVIPGPCALVAALALYGLEGSFQFVGFLKKKEGELTRQLIDMFYYPGISIAYVSPHNLLKVLKLLPERKIFLARELTKLYEETLYDLPSRLFAHFQKKKAQGEFVLIIDGTEQRSNIKPQTLMKELQRTFQINAREALLTTAKLLKLPKRKVYKDLHL